MLKLWTHADNILLHRTVLTQKKQSDPHRGKRLQYFASLVKSIKCKKTHLVTFNSKYVHLKIVPLCNLCLNTRHTELYVKLLQVGCHNIKMQDSVFSHEERPRKHKGLSNQH